MRLRCVSPYMSGAGRFHEGQLIEVEDDQGAFLMRDSPGSFVDEDAEPDEPTESVEPKPKRKREPRRKTNA